MTNPKPTFRGLISNSDLKQVGKTAIWTQVEKKAENSPDLSGTIEMDGKTLRIAFWKVKEQDAPAE